LSGNGSSGFMKPIRSTKPWWPWSFFSPTLGPGSRAPGPSRS
jgi:hypothetical protein